MTDQILDISKMMDIGDLPGLTGEEIQVYQPLALVDIDSNPKDRSPDLETDYSLVRRNMHYQQQMILDAAKIFLETAKNADSPRHMEVFATLMSQMTNGNKELLKLHKEMKDITAENIGTKGNNSGQSMNIENANIYVGSPTDMMDELGDSYDAKERQEKIINGTDSTV